MNSTDIIKHQIKEAINNKIECIEKREYENAAMWRDKEQKLKIELNDIEILNEQNEKNNKFLR